MAVLSTDYRPLASCPAQRAGAERLCAMTPTGPRTENRTEAAAGGLPSPHDGSAFGEMPPRSESVCRNCIARTGGLLQTLSEHSRVPYEVGVGEHWRRK